MFFYELLCHKFASYFFSWNEVYSRWIGKEGRYLPFKICVIKHRLQIKLYGLWKRIPWRNTSTYMFRVYVCRCMGFRKMILHLNNVKLIHTVIKLEYFKCKLKNGKILNFSKKLSGICQTNFRRNMIVTGVLNHLGF